MRGSSQTKTAQLCCQNIDVKKFVRICDPICKLLNLLQNITNDIDNWTWRLIDFKLCKYPNNWLTRMYWQTKEVKKFVVRMCDALQKSYDIVVAFLQDFPCFALEHQMVPPFQEHLLPSNDRRKQSLPKWIFFKDLNIFTNT